MLATPLVLYMLRQKVAFGKIIIYSLIAISGLLFFMLFLYYRTGDFLAFEHIQRAWGRHGWATDHLFIKLWLMLADYHNSIVFLISVILSVYLFVKRFYEEALFNLACILPGFLTGIMMSEGRFCGTLFTFYFGFTLVARNSWTTRIVILMMAMVLYMSYPVYWVHHSRFLI